MRMFFLKGDWDAIRALTDRVLTKKAKNTVFHPVMPYVLFMHGLNVVSSKTPPWDQYGEVREILAAFWVPVLAGRRENGKFIGEKLCMSLPYILVDNPISHIAGREIYGFPKALGNFTGEADELVVQGYGGDFKPGTTAGWFDFIRTSRAQAGAATAGDADNEEEAAAILAEESSADLTELDLDLTELEPGLNASGVGDAAKLFRRVISDFLKGQMNQVFLKQFRDAEKQNLAAYQEVIEAPALTKTADYKFERGAWRVELNSLASHPIATELGLRTQTPGFSVRITGFVFDVEPGGVITP